MSNLSIIDFEELWDAIHKSRKSTKHVSVKKRLLENLLMDYANLYDEVVQGPSTRNARWKRK